MRLGGFFDPQTTEELDAICEKLDCYGLSAIRAPKRILEMSDDECVLFGEKAAKLGLYIGEAGFWESMITRDQDLRSRRIQIVRETLRKADLMNCNAVVTLVGSIDAQDRRFAPYGYMYSDECKKEFREIVLRILDGMELKHTKYCIEPWINTFFYQPEEIREFIDDLGHPYFGVHLDQMNLISQKDFFNTTPLINRTFDMLADKVVSVHLKDLRWDVCRSVIKWDECDIGDGVMDYDTYLTRLQTLDANMTCYLEHMSEERDYALNFARLQALAKKSGVKFLRRGE